MRREFSLTKSMVMFQRYDKSKRVLALLGVVLTLSSGAYSTHLSCHLAGCVVSSGVESRHQLAIPTPESNSHSCMCTHTCKVTKVVLSTSGQSVCDHGEDGPCPCPTSCFCHRTPDPLDLPKDSSATIELVLSGTIANGLAVSSGISNCHQPLPFAPTVGLSPESSVARCALLCRFLI